MTTSFECRLERTLQTRGCRCRPRFAIARSGRTSMREQRRRWCAITVWRRTTRRRSALWPRRATWSTARQRQSRQRRRKELPRRSAAYSTSARRAAHTERTACSFTHAPNAVVTAIRRAPASCQQRLTPTGSERQRWGSGDTAFVFSCVGLRFKPGVALCCAVRLSCGRGFGRFARVRKPR